MSDIAIRVQNLGAVFLDRDGTIIEEVQYLGHSDGVVLLPGAARAIRTLKENDFLVVVVSNQSGVGRGYFSEADVEEVNRKLSADLGSEGAEIDAFYCCPHHPQAAIETYRVECHCRKPKPGMLEQAARELDIDLAGSFVVGDKLTDVEAGHRAGCHAVLVLTGYGSQELERLDDQGRPEFVASDLLAAAHWIVHRSQT